MGFITQAIAANFAPLLFLKFHNDYQIALGKIALISTCFFLTQLLVDLFCAKFVDKIGYRICIVASEVCSTAGLVGLAFLPELLRREHDARDGQEKQQYRDPKLHTTAPFFTPPQGGRRRSCRCTT